MSDDTVEGVLCYVSGAAYFTTAKLSEQWGDDWNDAPYEHNAGTPYEDKGKITKVFYDGPFDTPDEDTANSRFSVEDINRGGIAWLRGKTQNIFAGATFDQFKAAIEADGGKVYVAQSLRRVAPPERMVTLTLPEHQMRFIRDLVINCDIWIAPSIKTAFGKALAEAQEACGQPLCNWGDPDNWGFHDPEEHDAPTRPCAVPKGHEEPHRP